MVEHNLAKVGVESSNLFSRSKYGLKKQKASLYCEAFFCLIFGGYIVTALQKSYVLDEHHKTI